MKSIYKNKIIEYLKKYPGESRTYIAKLIAKEFGHQDKVEHIRNRIRYYSGVYGKKNYKSVKDSDIVKDYRKRLSIPIPEEYTDYKPLKYSFERVLVLADIHMPDHNKNAIHIAITEGKKKKVDGIILLGDVIDGYQISKFSKDPKKPSLSYEIEQCKQLFSYFKQELPHSKIIYKAGNHDGARLQSYIYRNAPDLSDLDALKLVNLLDCKNFDIDYISEMHLIKIGKLLFAHGNEFGGNPSVNIARSIFVKVQQNLVIGHFHRNEEYIDVNPITRETKGCYSVGCLSNTQPDYRPYSKYQQGFAIINFDTNGNFKVENKLIINGKLI